MAIAINWKNKTKFAVGDIVSVDYKIVEEGKKERSQLFQGLVISIKGQGEDKTFTVRKIGADNIGVERVFPIQSPWIKNIEFIRKPKKKPRRAKLYFLRKTLGRKKKKRKKK